jgi:hypothetical protein
VVAFEPEDAVGVTAGTIRKRNNRREKIVDKFLESEECKQKNTKHIFSLFSFDRGKISCSIWLEQKEKSIYF